VPFRRSPVGRSKKTKPRPKSEPLGLVPPANEPDSRDEPLQPILSLLRKRMQVDLGNYKLTTIRRRIERRMKMSRLASLAAYADHLRANPDALKALHDDLFIHVTQFFRDPDSFAALRDLVFPALLKGMTSADAIRVWVPGCSTGEEAYSIAIALTEFLEAQDAQVPVQIFATDISENAIARARKAVYPETIGAEMTPARLERFFERIKDGYKLRKDLRDRCIFSAHDLTSNPPFAKLDLISCRNVLIYFGADLQKRVLPTFHYALKEGGVLWLGRSETAGASSQLFRLMDKQHKLFAKVATTGARLSVLSGAFGHERADFPRLLPRPEKPRVPDLQRSADELVLSKYGPAAVLVNDDLDVLQFRGRTAPFLQPAVGKPTHSVLKMAHADLLPALRPLIQAVKRQNRSLRKESVAIEDGGSRALVNLEIAPLNPSAAKPERQYLILFEAVARPGRSTSPTPRPSARGRVRRTGVGGGTKDQYIEQLRQELDALRENQQTLVDQFDSAQEELTSANEELQATNEEFQSTNEELETAKEELQSANEELTTMNDELQGRNAELVEMNEKLARGEDRFRLMVEGVKDYAIYMIDPEGRVATWNEGARRLKGYESSEILGVHYARFFQPEDVAAGIPERELERARIEGRFETEGWRIRKDGSPFWANVVVTRMNDAIGTLIGFSKVTRDLSERKRHEDDLEKSERRFRLMISGVRDYAIFMLDPDWRVASWNEGARRLKGYEEAEVIGKHFSVFYRPEDIAAGKIEREIAATLVDGHVEDEGWRVRKDGSRFWASVVITRVEDADGHLIGFTKVTRDLSERKRAEDALREAKADLELRVNARTKDLQDALRARDEFLSIASHELKTPLTGLKLQLQMAKRRGERDPSAPLSADEATSTFGRALRQAGALEDLVEDLLDVSRIQTGRLPLEPKAVNLGDLVEEVAARFSDQLAQAQSRLELRLQPGIVGNWDGRRVTQVFVNLISNAIKYAPQSPLVISTQSGDDDNVVIEVADRGPGISPDKQPNIFERFERAGASANVGGLGLGLYIVRRIVEAHQGTVRVQSGLGQGTRFIIDLPLNPNEGRRDGAATLRPRA
jgi:two-component system CheB/CheR fusion protein